MRQVDNLTAGLPALCFVLQADALDFAGDAATYGISLAIIGASIRRQSLLEMRVAKPESASQTQRLHQEPNVEHCR
jgi:hypothetical protein